MNVNVYLPDDLGKRAKDADLPFSPLLRDAVTAELERREAMATALTDAETIQLGLEDRDGVAYKGRFIGKLIAANERNEVEVYLTDDERVLVYDGGKLDYWEITDPENDLQEILEPSAYKVACVTLGIEPVVDI